MLGVVGELVDATANEETPQLPRDLNTTNDIITEALDLLLSNLDRTAGQNLTVADVSFSAIYNYYQFRTSSDLQFGHRLQCFLKL